MGFIVMNSEEYEVVCKMEYEIMENPDSPDELRNAITAIFDKIAIED